MSSVNQCMRYCLTTSATESLNGVVPCFERHQSSAEYPGKEVGWTLLAFFDDFQTSTSQSSFNHLCVSSINRVGEILPMVYSFVHVRLTIGNPTRYIQISPPFIHPSIFRYRISKISRYAYCYTVGLRTSWIDEWVFAINLTGLTYDTVCACHSWQPSYF